MADKDTEFLKEAIADARAIKEVAVQNAKDVLEEAFTPKLQSMISARIQQEAEEEMEMDYEDDMDYEEDGEEKRADVSGEAEVGVSDTGELEDLELDLDFSSDEEPEMDYEEEPEMDYEDGDEELETDLEDELEDELEGGEEEEELEDDIDLEEVLNFLEEASGDHDDEDHDYDYEMEETYHEDEEEEMDEGSYKKKHKKDEGHGKRRRDEDIQAIINELEADLEEEEDLDSVIESFLDSLDNQVYEVDLNELTESTDRSGEDQVFEIDMDMLEEEYEGKFYGDDVMDGFDKVSQGDIGHHGGDKAADVDFDEGPSSGELGDAQEAHPDRDYSDDYHDGYDQVKGSDIKNHGPDEPADVDLDEGISYESLLSEIEAELEGSRSSTNKVEKLKEENEELKSKLNKHRQAVKILRNRINEVNLVNSKLLYTNRLFKRFNLNEEQKVRIIEALDRAQTKRGAKLVYSTLAEAFDSNVQRKNSGGQNSSTQSSSSKKNLAEAIARGMGSKKSGSQKPKKESNNRKILNEDVGMKERMQKLANINKRKGRK